MFSDFAIIVIVIVIAMLLLAWQRYSAKKDKPYVHNDGIPWKDIIKGKIKKN